MRRQRRCRPGDAARAMACDQPGLAEQGSCGTGQLRDGAAAEQGGPLRRG